MKLGEQTARRALYTLPVCVDLIRLLQACSGVLRSTLDPQLTAFRPGPSPLLLVPPQKAKQKKKEKKNTYKVGGSRCRSPDPTSHKATTFFRS